LEGGYTVDVKFASNSVVNKCKDLKSKFATDLIVMGGDACVPPNPQAAYGATLACESAQMVVQLAVAYGHLNSIIQDLDEFNQVSAWKRTSRD
jgi:tagatose-1,6-bisphosphate aldolase non-catalytic subunit AgaZ/GatZ